MVVRRFAFWLSLLMVGLLAMTSVQAAPPSQLSYYGILRGDDGAVVADESYTIRFALYSVASGGTAIWQETKTVAVEDGLFAVKLGTATALSPSLFTGTLYLGIKVESDSEMSPRTELLSSPYALNAIQLEGTTLGSGAGQIPVLDASSNLTLAGTISTTGTLVAGNGLTVSGTSTLQGLNTTSYVTFTGTGSGEPGANRGLRNTNASGTVYDWIRAVDIGGVTKTRMNSDGSWEWYYGAHDLYNPSGPLVVHFAGHGTVEVFPQTAGNGGFVVSPADDLTPDKDAFNITNAARTQSNWSITRKGAMYGKLNSGTTAQIFWLDNSDNILDVGTSSGLSGIGFLPGTTETMRITSGGLVGIGSSSPTTAKLVVVNADSGSNYEGIEIQNNEPSGIALNIKQDTSVAGNANFLITNAAGTATLAEIDNAGRLGLGRGVETDSLEVQNMTVGGDTYTSLFGQRANTGLKFSSSTDGDVVSERARITVYRSDTTTQKGQLGIFINQGAGIAEVARFNDAGDLGIAGCITPDHDLTIGGSGTGCDTGTFSEIDAGEASFTVSSSRALKQNFAIVSSANILDRIADVPVYTYDFKPEACSGDGCTDKMGLVAEDFHTVFGRGAATKLSGQEVQMALWLGIQELTREVRTLKAEVCAVNPTSTVCLP